MSEIFTYIAHHVCLNHLPNEELYYYGILNIAESNKLKDKMKPRIAKKKGWDPNSQAVRGPRLPESHDTRRKQEPTQK